LKKRTKKLFAPLRAVVKHPGSKTHKVFLLLFVHKKKFFLRSMGGLANSSGSGPKLPLF
jgi:hypothetical protein